MTTVQEGMKSLKIYKIATTQQHFQVLVIIDFPSSELNESKKETGYDILNYRCQAVVTDDLSLTH